MNDKTYYRKNFEERFGLKRRSFLSGFLFMFGIGENPYKNAVKKILNTSVEEALREDVRQLNGDWHRMMEKHKAEIPEIKEGTHRDILLHDVENQDKKIRSDRELALQELSDLDQELGLYD